MDYITSSDIPNHTKPFQIFKCWPNFKMSTKFHNFEKNSQFWNFFTIFTKFYSTDNANNVYNLYNPGNFWPFLQKSLSFNRSFLSINPFFQSSLSFNEAFLSIKHFFAHRAVSQFLRCFTVFHIFSCRTCHSLERNRFGSTKDEQDDFILVLSDGEQRDEKVWLISSRQLFLLLFTGCWDNWPLGK